MRTVWLSGVLVLAGVGAWGQAPASSDAQDKMCDFPVSGNGQTVIIKRPCGTGPAVPADTPLSKRLPYPGDPMPAEAPKAVGPDAPSLPGVPGESSSSSSSSSSSPMRDAGSSGESSSSSSGPEKASVPAEGPPPDPDDVNSDTPVAPKRNLHKKPVYSMEKQPIEEQEANDLQVAGFYMNDGNWRGAYGRAADAVKLVDEDPGAHLMLANAARKLGKLDEAVQEYKRTLALDPIPKQRKEAEKALKEMVGDN